MPTGEVRFLHARKRFGFIKRAAPHEDVFFHKSDAHPEIDVGDTVTFEVQHSDRGPRAVTVDQDMTK